MQDLTSSWLWFRLGSWLILVLGCNAAAAFGQAERNPVHSVRRVDGEGPARVIVKFRRDATLLRKHALSAAASARETLDTATARANSLGARLGLSLGAGRAISQHSQVITSSGLSGAALAARLATDANVEYAVIDRRRTHLMLPNDPLYTQGPAISGSTGGPAVGQWYLHAPVGEVAASINATRAWDLTTGSSNIVVAVVDTGVRPEHPDLANRLLPGYDMISDAGVADDADGRDADPSDPGDAVTAAESKDRSSPFFRCSAEGSSWHGTMMTSLIGAASNNGVGMAGVAWGVKLLPVRVLGKCGGFDSDIIAGMQWAAGLPVPGVPPNPTPARVINMSLGGSGACPQSYLDAINAIGGQQNPAVIVAAAGNTNGLTVGTPANCPGVIGVSGLRHIGTKVGFSDLGPEISISAPGGNCVNIDPALPCLYPILAASDTGTTAPASSTYTDSFNTSLGTSFAAPLVTGTVALMLSAQPTLTPADVKTALQSSARAFPFRGAADDPDTGQIQDCQAPNGIDQSQCYCTTLTCGAGMLDAASAVAAALGLQPRIGVTPSTLYPGLMATLSSVGTSVGNGRRIVSTQWSIVDGGGVVNTFDGGANSAQATLTAGAAGRYSVRLTVTDDQGLTASAETVLSVAPGVVTVTTTTSTTSAATTTTTTTQAPTTTSTTSTSAPTTSTTGVSTTTTSSATTTTQIGATASVNFVAGWNLAGNGSSSVLEVAAAFGDELKVSTVWKWIAGGAKWAFYTPSLVGQALTDYATSNGYDVLATIHGGEGYWVNAKTSFTTPLPAGTAISSASFQSMPSGWNLIAIGDNKSPSAFNDTIGQTPPPAADIPVNLTTLWAWDAAQSKWYFYAPSLDKSRTLGNYITSKDYLDFGTRVLDPTTGFWVNKP